MANKRKILDSLWGENAGSGKQSYGKTSSVDDDYIDQFISDANSYMDTIDEIVNGISYRTAKGVSYTQSRISDDLQDRAENILAYLDKNYGLYDDGQVQEFRSQIENFRNVATRGKQAAKRAREYYSQWDTEDAYNRAMQTRQWAQKYQGKGYQELVPLLESLEDSDEKTWLTEYAGAVDYNERASMDLNAARQEIQAMEEQLKKARNLNEWYHDFRHNPLLQLTQGERWRELESWHDSFEAEHGTLEELEQKIRKKRHRMAEGKQTQDNIRADAEYEAWAQTVRDAGTIRKDLEKVNAAIAMNERSIQGYHQESTQAALQQRQQAYAGRQVLEQQRAKLEKELQYSRMRDYMELLQRPDFAEKSLYVPTGNGVPTMDKGQGGSVILDPASGMYVNSGFQDIEYDYINKNERARAYQNAVNNKTSLKTAGLDRGWLLQLTDEETGIYNYLYRTEGKEAAGEFLDVMRGELNRRQRTAEETKWTEYAKAHPYLASAASIGLAPLKAVSAAGQVIDRIGDGKIDQNASYNRAAYISSAIRDQVTQQIRQNEKWGELGAFGYQTAMSMGDFLINGVAGGGFLGVPGVTMAIMGSGAAADTVISAKDRGIGDAQAFGLGIVAGLAEALTERFSLEALLDADLLKNGIGVYMLKNSLTEGSEEVASSIINLWADIAITKEKSEWQKTIRRYQDQGYDEGEAFAKAVAEQAASIGMDFIGGALSGGIMSGANSASYYVDTRRTGRAMGRHGLTNADQVQRILDEGANAEQGTAANAVAGQIQRKLDAGGKLSTFDKGRLYQSNPQTVSEAVFRKGSVQLAGPTVQGIDNKQEDWKQAERLASITGREIRFYNGDPKEDGFYDRKSGQIFINVDRASEHQAAYVFSHELTHSMEMAESYAELSRYVRSKLRANGQDWDQLKQEKADTYAAQGHPLENDADVEAEIVAEYVQKHLLTNEQEIYEAVWANPTLGQRILNWIDGILVKLNNQKARERQLLNNVRRIYDSALAETQNKEARTPVARKQTPQAEPESEQKYTPENLEYMDQLHRDQYSRGEITEEEYDRYLDWREHEAAAEEGAEELGRQYSIAMLDSEYADKQNYIDSDISSEEAETGIRDVATMAPVVHITGNEFAKSEVDLITQVEQFFAQENNEAYNPQIGTVILDRKGVKSDIAHGIGRKKAAAFAAVPDVIEKGRVVDYQKNWKSRGYDTAVIAAPILIAEEEHFAAVIAIRSRNTNLFYVHEVLTTKNGAMPFKTGARKSGLPSGDAPSIFSILNRLVEVKNNGEVSSGEKQFSITGAATLNKRDVARDLRAILSRGGDARELQRYVDGLEQTGRKAEQSGETRYQTEEKRYQTEEKRYQSSGNHNTTAQEILETAHSQGQSVEEYLRWNPEEFELDGRWRPEALEAMRMERGGRQYSLNTKDAENVDAQATESAESQPRAIQRENLPTKAKNYLARAESTLLNRIGEALSVPRHARYNSLKEIIQEISNTYLADGTISAEKLAELFDKAYVAGIVTDAEFYNQYKEIKDHLRTCGVTINDRDKNDIPDFNDFRKRAKGTLRIVNEGGVPVDTAYDELRNMAPELFPDRITHPADQLVRMFEVGQSIAVSQKNLDEYYGHSEEERKEFRKWAKNDFDAAVGDAFRDLRQVRRYAEEQSTQEDVKKILTVEEAEEAYRERKKLRWNVDKVSAKNLLTESDEILLGRMMKGEIGPQHLNPNEDNVKGITALYEAKMAYESQVEVLAAYKRSVKAKRLQEADRYLETATGWKDKRAGILYARETMRRNIMDIVPDKELAERIVEHYFEAVHIQEAKSTKFKNNYRNRVRALNLSTKVIKGNLVSEAHAVQLLGEAMDNIRVMENARGQMGMRDGKTLAEWRAVVDDLWMNNTGLDRQKIERAVEEFRKIYDELFQQMNRVRVENGYEPVNYRQGYFPHFQPGGDGIMGFFGKVMGINTQVDALPTTINGLTHTFKPGIQWFGNAQERLGFNTAYDAVEGFDRYIEGVASVIFQTENIQKLRALATQARYRTSDEGIRKQVDAVRMDGRLTEEEKQREINAIYEHGKFALSNFVAELDEYTNLLANKKSKYDRTMESLIGRRAYTTMKAWENRVGANMIAGNISSALTNFIPLTQAGAQLDRGMMLKGMWDTLKNMKQGDGLAGMSDFLTNRRGSDPLVRTWMQKASGIVGTPMELIDSFTSESIVRAAYLQNLKRGLSEAEAIHQADIFAAGVMADRSKGAMPTLFESRNPLFKAFTQFQLEVNNQFSEVFKDLPRNHREKGLAMLTLILLKYFLGAWMYNELFEKVIGRRSALDPFGILIETAEDLTGYEIPNIFDMAIKGERIEKTGEGSVGEAGANFATNVLGELPFSAGLNLFGFETDGGRLPAASAVPDLSAVWDAATEKELTGDQRWKMLQDELNKLAYVLPPFGGGQISKSYKGIKAYLEGGSYSLDKDGDEILQYPVYRDDPDDAFWSLVRAAFLGKNSLPEAQDWVKSGYDSLDQYETVVYHDLLNCGVKDRDAFALVDQLRKLEETETEDGPRRAQGRRILEKSDISPEGKAAAFYGMVATKTEREWMDELVDAGADQADVMAFVSNLYDADKLRGTEKKQKQYAVFLDAPLTEEEKIAAIGFIMETDMETEYGNPTQYAKFLSALETGLTVDKYMEIRSTETDIDDYLELTDVGIKGEKAADLSIFMAALEPEEGYDNVSWIQRCRTVMDADLSEVQKLQALQTVDGLYESTYEKIMTGHNFGMNVKSYIDLKSIMPQFDEDGNGNYTQAETEAAINALAGDDNVLYALTGTTPNGYTLTDKEKAILWQIQNKSWKPYRNPFDKEVGQMVYDYMTAEDPTEAVETAESGMGFDIANLFAKAR